MRSRGWSPRTPSIKRWQLFPIINALQVIAASRKTMIEQPRPQQGRCRLPVDSRSFLLLPQPRLPASLLHARQRARDGLEPEVILQNPHRGQQSITTILDVATASHGLRSRLVYLPSTS